MSAVVAALVAVLLSLTAFGASDVRSDLSDRHKHLYERYRGRPRPAATRTR